MSIKKLLFSVLVFIYPLYGHSQQAELYRTIVKLDSTFFHAYNTCDMTTQADLYADKLEFFHAKVAWTPQSKESWQIPKNTSVVK